MAYLSPQACDEVIGLAVRRYGVPWVLETVTRAVQEETDDGCSCGGACGCDRRPAVERPAWPEDREPVQSDRRERPPAVTDPRLLPETW